MIDTAIILAGGLGTRLRPLTDDTPKPLLPIKGKPIVEHLIENLKKYGVKNVILSIGYQAEQIKEYFRNGEHLGINITYSIEEQPLGTGGAIKQAAQNLTKPFFLAWGDNLADFDFHAMYKTYLRDAPQVTMTLTPREDVENFGVAHLEENKIISFVEKPTREEAPSNLINAGAFVIDPECLKILPEGKSSMEYDCFEKLAPFGEISAYTHDGQWFPTDSLEKYSHACVEFIPEIDFSKKKIIIADVDETICESCQQISEEMANKINTLIRKGYTFAFISGTGNQSLKRMISSCLTEEHHLLCNTGTHYNLIQDEHNESTIYQETLTEEQKQEINSAFEELIKTYNIQSLTTKEDQLQDRYSQITLSAIGRHAPSELKAQYDPDGEKRQTWVNFLQNILGDKYEIKIGGTTSVDVTKKGLDKEWGIRRFAQHHNFNLNEIIFFGDKIYPGGNDHAATKIVYCVAVKNPEDTLKKLSQLP
ncbi:MAG: HAD-IIB family hydrolase [Nanoarchaeota archaeon]|nr:HAD-IIB family hydrolase [Nanoarchaeota archaeon]